MASAQLHANDSGFVLDPEAWGGFSSDDAISLLRMLGQESDATERTFTSVPILPVADGRQLYIQPH